MSFLDKVFRIDARAFKKIQKKAARVFDYEDEFKLLSDADLQAKTPYLRKKLQDGQSVDDILPEAFATVREAARRVLGMEHYRVQLIGGVILHLRFHRFK